MNTMDSKTYNDYIENDRPISIFIITDPYGHYKPVAKNAVWITENMKGHEAESQFRNFISSNAMDARCGAYIPNAVMLRYDIENAAFLPPAPDGLDSIHEYVKNELLAHLQDEETPAHTVYLRDAVFLLKEGKDVGLLAEGKQFLKPADYYVFIEQQKERELAYRCQPVFYEPLAIIETSHGCHVFSDGEIGRRGFKQFLQHIADNYFDPEQGSSSLYIYQHPEVYQSLAPYIEKSFVPGGDVRPATFDFENNYSPSREVEKITHKDRERIAMFNLAPDSVHFRKFIDGCDLQISADNNAIYNLLKVKETGYIDMKTPPFGFSDEFASVAYELEMTHPLRNSSPEMKERYDLLSAEARDLAQWIMDGKFNVRGHRTIEEKLANPHTVIRIGDIVLDKAQRTVLSDKNILHIHAKIGGKPKDIFAWADHEGETIQHADKPKEGGVYTVKDGKISNYKPAQTKPKVQTPATAKKTGKTPKVK